MCMYKMNMIKMEFQISEEVMDYASNGNELIG